MWTRSWLRPSVSNARKGAVVQRAAGQFRGHRSQQGRQLHQFAQRQGRRCDDQLVVGRRRQCLEGRHARSEIDLAVFERPLRDRRRADVHDGPRRRHGVRLAGYDRSHRRHQPRGHRVDVGAERCGRCGTLRFGCRQRCHRRHDQARQGGLHFGDRFEQHGGDVPVHPSRFPEPLRYGRPQFDREFFRPQLGQPPEQFQLHGLQSPRRLFPDRRNGYRERVALDRVPKRTRPISRPRRSIRAVSSPTTVTTDTTSRSAIPPRSSTTN